LKFDRVTTGRRGHGNQPLCQIYVAVMINPNFGNDVTRLVVASQSVTYLDSLVLPQKPAPSAIMSCKVARCSMKHGLRNKSHAARRLR
jgi:hypothetical protein